MTNNSKKLSIQDVIDIINEINEPVAKIERELGIPKNVLARANKPDTKKPLPKKYEPLLLNYLSQKRQQNNNQQDTIQNPKQQDKQSILARKKEILEIVRNAKKNL